MHWHISLSAVYCLRIGAKHFRLPAGMGLLPCEKVWCGLLISILAETRLQLHSQ
jgi:hypothetical protein